MSEKVIKYGVVGLYSELYYSGKQIIQLNSLDELPDEEKTVFLLSNEFPPVPDREWINLFPAGNTYDNNRIMLWKGIKKDTVQ